MEYHLIKDIPQSERPRERLERLGPTALSDSELLAILLRTGTKQVSAISIANNIISEKGLPYLAQADVFELQAINGLGLAKAAQVKAAIELGRRVRNHSPEKKQIKMPTDVAALVMDEMQYLSKEEFRVLLLNTKNIVLRIETVSVGTANASLAVPREIFQKAVAQKAVTAIILVHNHPSGETTPSAEDIAITKRIQEAGKILGIEVLDHVIIGQGKFLSFKEEALF